MECVEPIEAEKQEGKTDDLKEFEVAGGYLRSFRSERKKTKPNTNPIREALIQKSLPTPMNPH